MGCKGYFRCRCLFSGRDSCRQWSHEQTITRSYRIWTVSFQVCHLATSTPLDEWIEGFGP